VPATKRVRIIKKIRQTSGVWRFISLPRIGARYVWDKRPGTYFVEWWQGKKRIRQLAGHTPSEATEAQRRKRNELLGELIATGNDIPKPQESSATPMADAIQTFLAHVRVHSPHKPKTHQRYQKVLEHFDRLLRKKKFIEAITRADIDDYKTARSQEQSQQHKGRIITPRTINFEVSVLRTFFYFLANERGIRVENPCARFKPLKDQKAKARRKPPTYTQQELDKIFAKCDEGEKTIFATLLLTGLRDQELCFLAWRDVDVKNPKNAAIKVSGEGKEGFSPKDYEERPIPIPEELAQRLAKLPRTSEWVFPNKKGLRMTHLLRRLKEIADAAKVPNATLHKFRHTYATRLLESGCDIVTVQKLMGHSDIETTRQYLDPDEALKRKAVNRLSLSKK
jgi:integrase/recombinase XerD